MGVGHSSSFKAAVRENPKRLDQFCNSLLRGEAQKVEEIFREYLMSAICIRDTHSSNVIKQQYYLDLLFSILDSEEEWTTCVGLDPDQEYAEIFVFNDGPESEKGIYIELRYNAGDNLNCVHLDLSDRLQEYTDIFEAQCVRHVLGYRISCNYNNCQVSSPLHKEYKGL